MATLRTVHACGCAACLAGDHPEREDHRQLNVLLSRLDEQQRRWVAAREALRLGQGGFQRIAEITGGSVNAPFAKILTRAPAERQITFPLSHWLTLGAFALLLVDIVIRHTRWS